ncbi:hypothetical protein KTC96_17355 [Clostridium estertheticum]|uniref:hypothetical protein n=1 Tax=Clostridium estertheticum TaxID=238834 RepID=UPI001C7E0B03|nr:hypothetical protein [Clostridium estertheticum]MBX4258344.1 hypothetical protein [Clostridium estertheticum]WLC69694.1 hypothetical protein KTC96_17355 [Clostridium estertheticum]
MKKPSIFSKDYDRKIKKRKKVILSLIIIPIIGLIIFLKIDFKGLINKGATNTSSKDDKVQKKSEEVSQQQANAKKDKITQAAIAAKAKASADKSSFIATMPNGQKVTVEYNGAAANKTIKGIVNAKDVSYDISPSKKLIVIQSTKNQDIIYVDINKTSKDITRKIYTSSNNQDYSKEEQLKNSPNYIWSITPKFIDEDNIAYVSELPWMNEKKVQYIWKLNLKDNAHMQVQPASGMKITFGGSTAKGLEANIDGDVVYVTALGEVTK